jgi:hypothetical protein
MGDAKPRGETDDSSLQSTKFRQTMQSARDFQQDSKNPAEPEFDATNRLKSLSVKIPTLPLPHST